MSSDISSLVMDVFNIVDSVIFTFGAFRAFQIGRALVTPTYRRQAFWTGALMLTFVLTTFLDDYVPFFSTSQSTVFYAFLSEIPSLAETLLLFAFIDGTLLAAIETDFFHRNTLWWRSVRVPAYAAMFVSLVVAETVGGYKPPRARPGFPLPGSASLSESLGSRSPRSSFPHAGRPTRR